MLEHSASVTIHVPVHQVYCLFTHFSDFPKYMSCIREVTYYDEQRSHWVVQVLKPYEWDAIAVDWLADQQVGWRSTSGLQNSGKVKFHAMGPDITIVDVYIQYIPPKGSLGLLADIMSISSYFDFLLQKDLQHFACMVQQAPPGALDPMLSPYLFHPESAVANKLVTSRQLAVWQKDPRMHPQALAERQARIEHQAELYLLQNRVFEAEKLLQQEQEQQSIRHQQALLAQEAERRQRETLVANQTRTQYLTAHSLDLHATYAACARTLGDKDGWRSRIPNFTQDPMTSRCPAQPEKLSLASSPE